MLKNQSMLVLERYLQRKFNQIGKILFYSKYTSVYHCVDPQWRQMGIYGVFISFFTKAQKVFICVLNKSNLQEFILEISSDSKLSRQDNILIIESSKGIFGIWFYDSANVVEVYRLIKESV